MSRRWDIFCLIISLSVGILVCVNSRRLVGGQDVRVYFDEGMGYVDSENYDKAIESFRKAIRENPNIPQLYNALGYALLKKNGTVKSASRAFQKAVELDPHYADPFFNLGTYYAGSAQDSILAADYFEKAIKADPKYAKAYMGLGWISLEKKDAKKAAEYFENATELEPDLAESQYGLGIAYMALKKNELTLKPITRLRAMNRNDLAQAIEGKMQEQEPALPPPSSLPSGAQGAGAGAAPSAAGAAGTGSPTSGGQQPTTISPQQQLAAAFGGGSGGSGQGK